MKNLLLLLFAIATLSSCVTSKKYKELDLVKEQYKNEYEALKPLVDQKKNLEQELATTRAGALVTRQERDKLQAQLVSLEKTNADLKRRYDLLLDQNRTVINTATSEKEDLRGQLMSSQQTQDEQQRKLDALQYMLKEKEANLEKLSADLAQREQKVQELESMVANQDAQMAQLKGTIDQALRGFTAQDLTVTEKNGKLYVSLNQGLLFPKGEKTLDFKGKNALKIIANALANTPSTFDIMVEGHTDSDGSAARNWELSTERAIAVVNELVADGVAPERITAAGRSFFAPIAPNDTVDNKAKNRRTEIIISPQLNTLYDIIEKR